MTEHFGYKKHEPVVSATCNARNGTNRRLLNKGEFGELPIEIPQRRYIFQPKLAPKHQTC